MRFMILFHDPMARAPRAKCGPRPIKWQIVMQADLYLKLVTHSGLRCYVFKNCGSTRMCRQEVTVLRVCYRPFRWEQYRHFGGTSCLLSSGQKWGRQGLYVGSTYLPKYAAPSHDISAFLARFILAECVELFVVVNFPDSPQNAITQHTTRNTIHRTAQ